MPFVDVTSDVCIIPPNSFALARSIEYFRIPRLGEPVWQRSEADLCRGRHGLLLVREFVLIPQVVGVLAR